MPRWFSIDAKCRDLECEAISTHVVAYENRDDPVTCPACGAVALRILSAPNLMQTSYPDGKRRPEVRNELEATRLTAESYDLPPEKRKEINKEIKKLRKVDK